MAAYGAVAVRLFAPAAGARSPGAVYAAAYATTLEVPRVQVAGVRAPAGPSGPDPALPTGTAMAEGADRVVHAVGEVPPKVGGVRRAPTEGDGVDATGAIAVAAAVGILISLWLTPLAAFPVALDAGHGVAAVLAGDQEADASAGGTATAEAAVAAKAASVAKAASSLALGGAEGVAATDGVGETVPPGPVLAEVGPAEVVADL